MSDNESYREALNAPGAIVHYDGVIELPIDVPADDEDQ